MEGEKPRIEDAGERPVTARFTQSLQFNIRVVSDSNDLKAAITIRSAAYSRHVPEVGRVLREAEADDHRNDVICLIAECKSDGRPLGSVRLQPNFYKPLRIEGETALPDAYLGRRLVEFMRLGVEGGAEGVMVSSALAKAGFEICRAAGVDYVLAAGRRSLANFYRNLGFDKILDGQMIPLSYANHLPHFVFSAKTSDFIETLQVRNPSFHVFVANTVHPDIIINYSAVERAFGLLKL